jgi:dephospho-CoA kinase
MRVGLTGGIGSGKSAVADMLAELGAFVIDTDELAREVVAPGSPALFQISSKWPQVIRNGELDRAALADVVFADEGAREQLNAIVHPRVRALAAEREKAAQPRQLLVHVVPLLFETGYGETLDRSIVVIASDENRIARVIARDGIDEERVRARMAAQIDPEKARSLADYVIANDADLAQLQSRTRQVYNTILYG